jgi:hypothetical protein
MNRNLLCLFLPFCLLYSLTVLAGVDVAPSANSEPVYAQLRNIRVSGEAYTVQHVKIVRDAATIELQIGTLCMLAPVNGVVTGAVFLGDGTFHLRSDDPREQNQMRTLTKETGIDEHFEKLVLRFADGTAQELTPALTVKSSDRCPADLLEENQKYLRTELRDNLTGRLLQPVLAGKPDGYFTAFFQGTKYGKMQFELDPQGLTYHRPEEVALFDFEDSRHGMWYGGHLLSEPREGWRVKKTNHETGFIKAVSHKIDVTIEKNGHLTGTSTETFTSLVDGLRVVPFQLFGKLRVSQVKDANGTPLGWIQENKDEDADYFVLLPKPAAKGEQISVTTTYSGDGVVINEGAGNYYLVLAARENWYPNTHMGDYASFQMCFRIPKGLTMAATGTLVSEKTEGGQNVTEWKSDVPLSVAGFNFGDFKSESVSLDKVGVTVSTYVNKELPESLKKVLNSADSPMVPKSGGSTSVPNSRGGGSHSMGRDFNSEEYSLGSLNTTPMLKKSLAESSLAVELYSTYFGPMPYKNLLVTQQSATGYGEGWPGLVYLPAFYYLDETQRHQIGTQNQRRLQVLSRQPGATLYLVPPSKLSNVREDEYWKVVAPRMVAHQWWGGAISFASYRDAWISQGFADFSAALYIQQVRGSRTEYEQFWKDTRDSILEKDKFGHRPIDVGSVVMGNRVATGETERKAIDAIMHDKGAYILQMLRCMMYTQKKGDADFKAMMQDLVSTYRNQAITTEDFKAMVEKHMTPTMDAAGNHKMDWFFDEWVYGTEIPSYSADSASATGADGKTVLTLSVSQSGVSPNFRMVVPVYYELPDGRVGKLGQVLLVGNQTTKQTVPFSNPVPKRLFINYNYDVLSAN